MDAARSRAAARAERPRGSPLARMQRRALGYMRFAQRSVGASAASFFLVDSGELRGCCGDWDWTRTSFSARLKDWPTVERVLAEGRLRVLHAEDAQGSEVGWFEPRGIVSTVCVPLRVGPDGLGFFFFDFDAPRPELREADLALLAEVGVRSARALERVRHAARRGSAGEA